MVHVSAELLAGHALGQPDQLDGEQLDHVAGCPQCRAELSQLSRLVELSQQEPDPALGQAPLDAVWHGVREELSLSESAGGRQTRALVQLLWLNRCSRPTPSTAIRRHPCDVDPGPWSSWQPQSA